MNILIGQNQKTSHTRSWEGLFQYICINIFVNIPKTYQKWIWAIFLFNLLSFAKFLSFFIRYAVRVILTQSGLHSLMVPRTVFLVSFLPLHSCISGEGNIVTHMTQVYSACSQTQHAVRFVYWNYILPGLLWKITESLSFSMYTFGINKPLSNTVLPPLPDSLSYKILLSYSLFWTYLVLPT